ARGREVPGLIVKVPDEVKRAIYDMMWTWGLSQRAGSILSSHVLSMISRRPLTHVLENSSSGRPDAQQVSETQDAYSELESQSLVEKHGGEFDIEFLALDGQYRP